MKRTFYIKAVWDDEAGVFVSESDIVGLHIQADTLDEFEEVMQDAAPELVAANHVMASEYASTPLQDLIPAILWQRPPEVASA